MRFIEDKPNLLRFLRVLDPEEISPRWDNVRLAEYPGVAAATTASSIIEGEHLRVDNVLVTCAGCPLGFL